MQLAGLIANMTRLKAKALNEISSKVQTGKICTQLRHSLKHVMYPHTQYALSSSPKPTVRGSWPTSTQPWRRMRKTPSPPSARIASTPGCPACATHHQWRPPQSQSSAEALPWRLHTRYSYVYEHVLQWERTTHLHASLCSRTTVMQAWLACWYIYVLTYLFSLSLLLGKIGLIDLVTWQITK